VTTFSLDREVDKLSERVKNAIRDKIVKPEIDKIKLEANGEVLKVYNKPEGQEDIDNKFNRNVADVKVIDSQTGKTRVLEEVPITHGSNTSNFDGRHIREGDKVVIDFVGGNPAYPQIIGRSYGKPNKRHDEILTYKGVNIADAYGYFG